MHLQNTFAAQEALIGQSAVPIGFLTDLLEARTSEEVRQTYAEWCKFITGAARCSIGLPIDDNNMLVCSVAGRKEALKGRVYPMARSTLGQAFLAKKTIMIDDLAHQDSEGCRTLAALGMKTVLVVPILSGRRCFGVISCSYTLPKTEVAKKIQLLEVVAGCLSTHLMLIEKMQELGTLAWTDPLTGALNRHRFEELSTRMWQDWKEIGRPFTVASIDLDHFKLVNDTMGHAVGDTVLQEVVRRLKSLTRDGDQVVRMGGEEFCVLMNGVGKDHATHLVRRLHRAIRDAPVNTADGLVAITASIGCASARYDDDSFEQCLKRSDQALYQAKAAGRDRIEQAADP